MPSARHWMWILALCASPSLAAMCSDINVPFDPCVNDWDVPHNIVNARLVSDASWSSGVLSISYEADLRVDALLNVRWTDDRGATLLYADNTLGTTLELDWRSWQMDWVGLYLPEIPVGLRMGAADFGSSFPAPIGCATAPCDAR